MKVFQRVVLIAYAGILLFILVFFTHASNRRNPDGFDLCGWGVTYPYYASDSYYERDFLALKNHVRDRYDPPASAEAENGIVRIRFMINCRGEAGNYRMETYDADYRKAVLSPAITTQLLALTKDFAQWKTPQNHAGEPINIHKFFAFKIVRGEITEILPK